MPLIYNTEVSSDLGTSGQPGTASLWVDNGMARLLAQQLPAEIILSLYPTANAIFSSLSDKQNCIQMSNVVYRSKGLLLLHVDRRPCHEE